MPDLDYSFSGIKTGFLNFLNRATQQDAHFVANNLADICASIQQTLIDMLLHKLIMATETTGIRQVAIAGGVSANSGLRKAIQQEAQNRGWQVYIPQLAYCTDNAAMIAMAAHYQYLAGEMCALDVSADPRLKLK